MTRMSTLLACTLALLCGIAGPAAAGPGPEEQPWEPYEVLVTRNIFSRSRGRRAAELEQEVKREAPSPERFVYLRGVIRREEGFVALLEDTRSGEVMRVRAGDAVVQGAVSEITLDGIRYVRDEQEMAVAIGENLEKAAPVAASEAAAGAGEAAAPAAGGSGPPADMLERLRQKRQRELGT